MHFIYLFGSNNRNLFLLQFWRSPRSGFHQGLLLLPLCFLAFRWLSSPCLHMVFILLIFMHYRLQCLYLFSRTAHINYQKFCYLKTTEIFFSYSSRGQKSETKMLTWYSLLWQHYSSIYLCLHMAFPSVSLEVLLSFLLEKHN